MISYIVGRIEGKLAVKTAIAAGLAWAIGIGFSHLMNRPDSLISGLWCTLAAIVVIQAHIGGTYKAAWVRFLGVIVGSLLGGICTTYLGANPLTLGLSVFLTVIICCIGNVQESIRIACMSTSVVMVLWGMRPDISPWTFAFFRMIDSCLGILIAVAVAHVIWPFQATEKLRSNMSNILVGLDQLFRFATREDLEGSKIEEHTLNLITDIQGMFLKDQDFLEESKMELLTRPTQLENWSYINEKLSVTYFSILRLHKVYPYSKKIFDSTLQEHLKIVVEQIEIALQELSRSLAQEKPIAPFNELTDALEKLQADRARFRNTYTTRKFELHDVENFFVFFYSIETIAANLDKIRQKMISFDKKDN